MFSGQTRAVTLAPASPHASPGVEERLIERSRSGDLAAFDQLVERHYTSVHAVARRLSPSPDDAEDVAQEVFLAAWKQISRFHQRASFRTWLIAICVRQCAARVRTTRPRPLSLDEPLVDEPAAPSDGSPASTLERREREAALHRAIGALPRAQREAVVLHYFGGLTCADTASAMGISAGAVMTHLFRARKTLRDTLGWLAEGEVSA
jgi:RNA polymerase sigma-70 factor (ECF subfamily)